MKSVRTRILVSICIFVSVTLAVVGSVTIFLNTWTTNSILEQTMTETVKVASDRISYHLRTYKTIAEDAGLNSIVGNPDVSIEEKQAYLDTIAAKYPDILRGNILDKNGVSIFTGQEFSDRDYFQQSITGKSWVSDPLVSKVTGAITIIISAPVYYNGEISGVLYLVPVETFLNDIVSSIHISQNGGAVIINKNGVVVAHQDMDFVANGHNSQELAKSDSAYSEIAALEHEMVLGKTGFGSYAMNGVEKIMAYAPIPDTNGWSMNVNAPSVDFMSYTITSIVITAILLLIALIAAAILALRLAGGIGKPLKILSGALSDIATTGRIEMNAKNREATDRYAKQQDEVGGIALAVNGLINMLTASAQELETISNGDLTADIAVRSPEDTLGNALCQMTGNLNNMFSGIRNATSQVSAGAKQIADGSQALAQGSSQQAAAVEQLSASISAVAAKTQENSDMAAKAAKLANEIKHNAERGSHQMDSMMEAVREINAAGQSISKVIKVIDDIAFQTNILALNAAVEAARAGQHGKGFAVVAEEVRNLAAKSAEAAKDTGSLIANSIEKAELGVKIADETAASLAEIVSGINESSKIVSEIAGSSEEQSEAIVQINRGIDQVSQVVQQNSATAEQSAAASEEMSGQSNVLEELISQFKLIESGNNQPSLKAPDKQNGITGNFAKY